MYLRSPALGKSHICDSLGLAIGNYKALPGRPYGGKLPPHIQLGAQPAHYSFLEGVSVKDHIKYVFPHVSHSSSVC